ncbi:Uncharacterized protein OBRU01_24702 [Operophtera brumata]|uniref:Uncharacterized protein n=1 Tax=Operophtera brumata TaxID=104452 RepID=A0A0L7KKG9_OPEBR|nr:Uncharacterized protein OBRU01_24702 [Operophtera brumata]
MASTPKQQNGSGSNSSLGKRKKSRASKSTDLSKWLDKTMYHVQEATLGTETYDFVNPKMNWQISGSQFAPGYDPYRHMCGAPEPMSLPSLPSYYSPPMLPHSIPISVYPSDHRYVQNVKSVQVQRPRIRRRNDQRAEELQSTSNCLEEPSLQPKNLSDQDYASLPPIITSVGDTNSNSDINDKEKDDGSNARRYSDPCVRGLPDVARPANGGDVDSESDDSSSASESQVGSRLLSCLLDQIASLKLTNDRLNKELLDTRGE